MIRLKKILYLIPIILLLSSLIVSAECIRATEVSAGYHTCILLSDGNVDCYGDNSFNQAEDYTTGDAIGVAAGGYHTCILQDTGNVDCYGRNAEGQSEDYTGGDAVGVAAGVLHTCILLSDGNVNCYGHNTNSQSEDYTTGDAIGVAAGGYHTCILQDTGNVDCYGYNTNSQAEDYTGGDAVGVAAGTFHTCILLSDGNVDCYGHDEKGQDYTLGDAVGVAAGAFHTCILLSDGNVNCYGENKKGQAEDYTTGDAIGVAAGAFHTCILLSDGNVNCYGNNDDGQAEDFFISGACQTVDCGNIDACEDYTQEQCGNCGGECTWQFGTGCVSEGTSACGNDIKGHAEFCDGTDLDGETCESKGFVSGTLACWPPLSARPCEFDTSLCNTGATTCETIGVEQCSDYKGDIFDLCELDGTDQACTVGPCYIGDETDDTSCTICLNDFLCSDYPTSTKCIANSCEGTIGFDCKWEGDEATGNCIENEEFTEIIGTEQCIWNCAGATWSQCENGIRQTSIACTLSSDNSATCGEDQVKQVSCKITKKFPFFSTNGIILVLALLIGYYVFVNSNKKKK